NAGNIVGLIGSVDGEHEVDVQGASQLLGLILRALFGLLRGYRLLIPPNLLPLDFIGMALDDDRGRGGTHETGDGRDKCRCRQRSSDRVAPAPKSDAPEE